MFVVLTTSLLVKCFLYMLMRITLNALIQFTSTFLHRIERIMNITVRGYAISDWVRICDLWLSCWPDVFSLRDSNNSLVPVGMREGQYRPLDEFYYIFICLSVRSLNIVLFLWGFSFRDYIIYHSSIICLITANLLFRFKIQLILISVYLIYARFFIFFIPIIMISKHLGSCHNSRTSFSCHDLRTSFSKYVSTIF